VINIINLLLIYYEKMGLFTLTFQVIYIVLLVIFVCACCNYVLATYLYEYFEQFQRNHPALYTQYNHNYMV